MISRSTIFVAQIGARAASLLEGIPVAEVWGATSRGVFIRLSSGWIIYLTMEDVPGPLTLNLEGDAGQLDAVSMGDGVRISSHLLDFIQTGIEVDFHRAAIWKAPPPPETPVYLAGCRLRLRETVRLALVQRDRAGRAPGSLFQSFLAFLDPGEHTFPSDSPWSALLPGLARAWQEKASGEVEGSLEAFLGLGSGLTPSGDDLILGFLLALERWGGQIIPKMEIKSMKQTVVAAAYSKTTTLSANLIQCAAEGQANQRLIRALDGIMTGIPDARQCASLLASWGSSSGLDVLAGMGIAIG